MARKPSIDSALRATAWGQQAIAAGARDMAQAAILYFLAMRKSETASENVLLGDGEIAKAVRLSTPTALASLTDLMEREIIEPVRGILGEHGFKVSWIFQGRVDALRRLDLPSDVPRRRASMDVKEVLNEAR
ncbi:MAG TPA: hypothetical protein VJ890_23385 [Vineibacter sp.]|nr:hypothetical protein [Vineibacter sp.]